MGDKVQTRNEETGEVGYNLVEELFQRETDETYHVRVDGTTIITTAEHPFWVADQGWVEARDLKEGDKLLDLDENEIPIEEIEVKKERITVYNFRVQGVHNYFVTDLKIWTHNCGGRDGAMSGGRSSSIHSLICSSATFRPVFVEENPGTGRPFRPREACSSVLDASRFFRP
ncbi:polymorphic toxin-type HINT domain-containing protein [Paenibacillus thiaminolyticus]|uniref:polymorphic toxin-type HINT domain-containing protein n=1 Tax=Paenibacillus thiaminolyticus TaxID=49283 RepID=UPI0035A6F79F